jgi:hypothetical protein
MIKPAGKQSIDVGRVDPPPESTMMTDMDVRASSRVGGEPNNSDVGLGRGIVKKMGPPYTKKYSHRPRSQWQALLSAAYNQKHRT